MITTSVLLRTFHIQYGNGTGTCFTIDIDNRQYLVTAKHVVSGFPQEGVVSLYHDGCWKEGRAKLVGHANDPIDITVLSLDFQLSPSLALPASEAEMQYGQDVYFLGFPYGWFSNAWELQTPMPFVKSAILSNIIHENGVHCFFLDGNNNPGFSGGPVVFTPRDKPNDFRVAAVVSGFQSEQLQIYSQEQPTGLVYQQNTGIIITYSIRHAVELIKQNPIGCLITDSGS